MSATWDDMAAGADCPMDYPRSESEAFGHFVRKLAASSLYLNHNQAYRGHCVLIHDLGHATRIDQLSPTQWSALATRINESIDDAAGKPFRV